MTATCFRCVNVGFTKIIAVAVLFCLSHEVGWRFVDCTGTGAHVMHTRTRASTQLSGAARACKKTAAEAAAAAAAAPAAAAVAAAAAAAAKTEQRQQPAAAAAAAARKSKLAQHQTANSHNSHDSHSRSVTLPSTPPTCSTYLRPSVLGVHVGRGEVEQRPQRVGPVELQERHVLALGRHALRPRGCRVVALDEAVVVTNPPASACVPCVPCACVHVRASRG